jgi:hypothetical protein
MLRDGPPKNRGSITGCDRDFSLQHRIQSGYAAQPDTYTFGKLFLQG